MDKNKKATRREHYVPVFYLQKFADKDTKLRAYNYKSKEIKCILPKNICAINDLYETPWKGIVRSYTKYVSENYIENKFQSYEGEFASLLNEYPICHPLQILREPALNEKQENTLKRFISNLIVRNPYHMKNIGIDIIPLKAFEDDNIINIYNTWESLGLGNPDSLCHEARKRAVLLEEVDGSAVNQVIEVIGKLDWFLCCAKDSEFVTSDNPVCLIEFIGDSIEESEDRFEEKNIAFYFALTPKVAVWFLDLSRFKRFGIMRNRMVMTNDWLVDQFNRLHLNNKERAHFLIGKSQKAVEKYTTALRG